MINRNRRFGEVKLENKRNDNYCGFDKMKSYLGGHLELTVGLDDTSYVKVEEVGVKNGLYDSGNNGDWVEEALGVVSINPVEDVKESVGSEGKEVVSSDGFGVSSSGEHEELWHDGDCFQVDGECPHNLHEHEFVVDDEGKNDTWDDKELDAESIIVAIVGCFEFHPHEVDSSDGSGKEEHLHHSVVQGIEASEEIQVSCEEGDSEEYLGAARDSFATA